MSSENDKKITFISELRQKGKINSEFLDKVSELTLEELVAIKIELSAKMISGKLYNFPIWYSMPYIVREGLLNFVHRNCKSKADMSNTLGLPYENFIQIYNKFLNKKE
jgi:hypothetical protein